MKSFIAAFSFILISIPVFSQKLIGLNYSMSFPFGETHQFINKSSFRGAGLEGRWFLSDHVSMGFSAGWHAFYKDQGHISETSGTTTTSGFEYKYINDIPVLLTAHYYTGINGNLQFYAGGGLGTAWAEQRTDLGIYTSSNSNWHFAVAPEVGMLLPIGLTKAANVAVQYHYQPSSGNSMNYSYLTLKLGLLFR